MQLVSSGPVKSRKMTQMTRLRPAQKPPPRRERRGAPLGLLLAALAALGGGCRSRSGSSDAATDPALACRSACAALLTAGCGDSESTPGAAARCNEGCQRQAAHALAARCQAEWTRYVECSARARVTCARCSPAVCLEHRQGIEGCEAEHAALAACTRPCDHVGLSSVVDRTGDAGGGLSVEIVRAGCAACPEPKRAAPAGSPCQAASVCSQVCCECPDGRAKYLARSCSRGICAARPEACSSARAAAPIDPCTGEAQRR